MKTKTYFAFRVDIWDDTGDSIIEHVAGVDDFEVAERAAVARWPTARIRLRQGARVIEDSRRLRAGGVPRGCVLRGRTFIVILRLFAQESYGGSLCWLSGREPKYYSKSIVSAGGDFLAYRRDELPGAKEMFARGIIGHVASFNASPRRRKVCLGRESRHGGRRLR